MAALAASIGLVQLLSCTSVVVASPKDEKGRKTRGETDNDDPLQHTTDERVSLTHPWSTSAPNLAIADERDQPAERAMLPLPDEVPGAAARAPVARVCPGGVVVSPLALASLTHERGRPKEQAEEVSEAQVRPAQAEGR